MRRGERIAIVAGIGVSVVAGLVVGMESQDRAIQQLQRENDQLELCVAALIRALKSRRSSVECVRISGDIVDGAMRTKPGPPAWR